MRKEFNKGQLDVWANIKDYPLDDRNIFDEWDDPDKNERYRLAIRDRLIEKYWDKYGKKTRHRLSISLPELSNPNDGKAYWDEYEAKRKELSRLFKDISYGKPEGCSFYYNYKITLCGVGNYYGITCNLVERILQHTVYGSNCSQIKEHIISGKPFEIEVVDLTTELTKCLEIEKQLILSDPKCLNKSSGGEGKDILDSGSELYPKGKFSDKIISRLQEVSTLFSELPPKRDWVKEEVREEDKDLMIDLLRFNSKISRAYTYQLLEGFRKYKNYKEGWTYHKACKIFGEKVTESYQTYGKFDYKSYERLCAFEPWFKKYILPQVPDIAEALSKHFWVVKKQFEEKYVWWCKNVRDKRGSL